MSLNTLKFICIFLALFSKPVFAAKKWENDPQNTLGMKLGIAAPSFNLDIQDKQKKLTPIKYRPHVPVKTFVSLSYASFGLTGSLATSLNENDKIKKGESNSTDLQFRFFLSRMTLDFFYQYYAGYYIENSEQIDNTLTSDSPRIQRPDIKTISYGTQFFYWFDPDDYSQGAAFDHSRRQKSSGGSTYLLTALGSAQVQASSPIIPALLASSYGESSQFTEGTFQQVKLGFGYGHNFIYGPVYFAILLGVAAGQQQQRYSLQTRNVNHWVDTNGINGKLGLGYNGEKYYAGFQLHADSTVLKIEDTEVSAFTQEISFFWGLRFFDVSIPWLNSLDNFLFN